MAWLLALGLSFSLAASAHAEEQQKAKVTATDVMRIAQSLKTKGEELLKTLEKMVSEAESAKDMQRIKCLTEKRQQVAPNVATATEWAGKLSATSPQGDVDQANTVLTVIAQKLQTLIQEANQCVGQDMFEQGSTKIETEIDKSLLPADNSSNTAPTLLPPSVPVIPTNASGKK